MTPEELDRIAGKMNDLGVKLGTIPLISIQHLQKWASLIRMAEAVTK